MAKPPSNRKKATSPASTDLTSAASSVNEDISQQEDPGSATITISAVEVPELTEEEQRDRLHLERRVERAFFEAGKALTELRDRRLYRSTHKTFEDYCRDRFGYSRRQPYLLMEAAVIFDNLLENCDRNDHILPTNEWQISFNGDITTMGQRRSCTRDRAKLSASGVPCYASCQTSAVEWLYIINTALNRVQLRLCNWLEMNKTR